MVKAGPQSTTVREVKLHALHFKCWTSRCWASFQGGQPEAGRKQLQVRVVREIQAACAKTCGWEGSYQEGTRNLQGPQKHLIQNSCSAWRTAWSPLGVKRRPPRPRCGSSPWPPLEWDFREWTVFSWALLPGPAIVFLPFLEGFIKVFGSVKSCNKPDALGKKQLTMTNCDTISLSYQMYLNNISVFIF